jgi:choline dehydrogenase-like flavoprotein
MLWTRGCPGNYETWGEMGLTEWAWEKVEPWFTGLEDCTGEMGEKRGRGGPVELRKPEYPYKWLKL